MPKEINGDFNCNDAGLKSFRGGPTKIVGEFRGCYNSNLPKEVYYYSKKEESIVLGIMQKILEYGEDYSIWREDDTLNLDRFNDMMEEIKEDIMKGIS